MEANGICDLRLAGAEAAVTRISWPRLSGGARWVFIPNGPVVALLPLPVQSSVSIHWSTRRASASIRPGSRNALVSSAVPWYLAIT